MSEAHDFGREQDAALQMRCTYSRISRIVFGSL